MVNAFTKLFETGKIGNLEIRNRIVMPAMGTHWGNEDGFVTQRQIDYYAERARGGVGLVTTEAICVQATVGKNFQQILIDNDKYLPGLNRLAEAIKRNGAKAAVQLHHAGAAATRKLTGGLMPVAPSALLRRDFEPNRSLTLAEIREIRDCFVQGAFRCHKAGFDAVELHAAHHYLLAQFLSPVWNERTDEYGGTIENRSRLLIEIVSGIRSRIPTLPIICRLNAKEYGTEETYGTRGLTVEDAQTVARLIEANGASAVDVSCFGYGSYRIRNAPMSAGEMLPLCERIRSVVRIPIIAVGRMLPGIAEQALRTGKVDFIGIGRGLLADPYLPEKLLNGNSKDIAPCITCYECFGVPRKSICTVNPRVGEEATYPYTIQKAAHAKKVVIVGGGPGGMEAARVAALRGHHVILYERDNELGGQLLVADKAPCKENIHPLIEYLKQQLASTSVKVQLGTKATAEIVIRHKPDAVIIATGAEPMRPNTKGLEKAKVVQAVDVLAGKVTLGDKVIVVGGEMVGCEAAEFLAERGKDVTITRRGPELATKVNAPRLRSHIIARLKKNNIKFEGGVTYKEASESGLVIIDKDGKERTLEANTIVLATGAQSRNELLLELTGKVPSIFCIGDAVKPRRILDAIHEGFEAAYHL